MAPEAYRSTVLGRLQRRYLLALIGVAVATLLLPIPADAWGINSALRNSADEHPFETANDYSGYTNFGSDRIPPAPISYALPNPHLTPGAIDPRVTETNLSRTICRPGGYTRSVRPPESYTEPLKRRQIREYGYWDKKIWHYREDHLVPLEAGGAPYDPRNLWPEPRYVVGGWGSETKDELENRLHHLICEHRVPLATAQHAIASNWIAAFKKYIGPKPSDGHRYRY